MRRLRRSVAVGQRIDAGSIGCRLEFSRLRTRTSRRNITVDADTMDLFAEP